MIGQGTAAVLSGASGVGPVTAAELAFLDDLRAGGRIDHAWVYGDLIGHAVEAHFPAGIALAALALHARRVSPAPAGADAGELSSVDRIVVTGVGHGRGEGVAVLEPVRGEAADGP
jgi:3-oxoacyl-[acyl-carrier-protein] synthase II